MKHLLRHAASLTGLALASVAVHADNVIRNPGFEDGTLLPWYQDRDVTGFFPDWTVSPMFGYQFVHSGQFSGGVYGNKEIRQDFTPTPVGDILSFTYWLRHPFAEINEFAGLYTIDRPQFVSVFYSDATVSTDMHFTRSADWEQFDLRSLLVPGKTVVGFSVFGYGGAENNQFTFLDDVELLVPSAPVPEPSTWALLLTGAGLVGGLARRRSPRPDGSPAGPSSRA